MMMVKSYENPYNMLPCENESRMNFPSNLNSDGKIIGEMGAWSTVYPKKYADGFCFAVLCCGYTLTDFPISIRLTSLALWQSNDCPSASKATLMNMNKYFMWIHYERLHNHNKAKHNKAVCIFLGIYCISHTIATLCCICFHNRQNLKEVYIVFLRYVHLRQDKLWFTFKLDLRIACIGIPIWCFIEMLYKWCSYLLLIKVDYI